MASIALPAPRRARLRSLARRGLRWLYLGHRWLGIATCLLCAMWFVSGLVMVYVPFPGLSSHDRIAYSEPVAFERVVVAPDAALAAAGLKTYPSQFKLTMLRGEPVYRMVDGKRRLAVSAVDGRPVPATTPAVAAEVVHRLLPGQGLGPVRTLFNDQWTVAQGFDPHRPLHRVSVGDAAGRVLYVSSVTGEVVNETTRRERMWNWVGSIPHWIYLTVIRQDQAIWRQVILWTSGPALVGALVGMWLGVLRMRIRRGQAVSPYRGWMKWHHLSGLIAGLFAVTWIFSGWLSVNPFQWFPRRQTPEAALMAYAGHRAPDFPARPEMLKQLPLGEAREARCLWIGGRPLVVLMGPSLDRAVFDARTGAPGQVTDQALFEAARTLVPGAPVVFARRLTQEDAYWYATRRDERRLPVLRVGFADPHATWIYLDPQTGEVLGRTDRSRRIYRWLFDALHAWELPVFRGADGVRQVVIWVLAAGGLVLSISGLTIGWRRLKRKFGTEPKSRRAILRPKSP